MAPAAPKLVKPLDIDKVLGKARNQVFRVGIELEGGWNSLPEGTNDIIRDGSVEVSPPDNGEFQKRYRAWEIKYRDAQREGRIFSQPPPVSTFRVGELPSPPMEVEKVEPWMNKFYPHAVNATCGLHVHMSFKTALQYQRLMTPAYPATVVEYFQSWAKQEGLPTTHPLWQRLSGKNQYCRHEFHAQEQVVSKKDHNMTRPGHRYTVINYCYSVYGGTLECRLLPMMDTPAQGIRAVMQVINITNAFLAVYREREERARAKVEAGDPVRQHKQEVLYPERRQNIEIY